MTLQPADQNTWHRPATSGFEAAAGSARNWSDPIQESPGFWPHLGHRLLRPFNQSPASHGGPDGATPHASRPRTGNEATGRRGDSMGAPAASWQWLRPIHSKGRGARNESAKASCLPSPASRLPGRSEPFHQPGGHHPRSRHACAMALGQQAETCPLRASASTRPPLRPRSHSQSSRRCVDFASHFLGQLPARSSFWVGSNSTTSWGSPSRPIPQLIRRAS